MYPHSTLDSWTSALLLLVASILDATYIKSLSIWEGERDTSSDYLGFTSVTGLVPLFLLITLIHKEILLIPKAFAAAVGKWRERSWLNTKRWRRRQHTHPCGLKSIQRRSWQEEVWCEASAALWSGSHPGSRGTSRLSLSSALYIPGPLLTDRWQTPAPSETSGSDGGDGAQSCLWTWANLSIR